MGGGRLGSKRTKPDNKKNIKMKTGPLRCHTQTAGGTVVAKKRTYIDLGQIVLSIAALLSCSSVAAVDRYYVGALSQSIDGAGAWCPTSVFDVLACAGSSAPGASDNALYGSFSANVGTIAVGDVTHGSVAFDAPDFNLDLNGFDYYANSIGVGTSGGSAVLNVSSSVGGFTSKIDTNSLTIGANGNTGTVNLDESARLVVNGLFTIGGNGSSGNFNYGPTPNSAGVNGQFGAIQTTDVAIATATGATGNVSLIGENVSPLLTGGSTTTFNPA